jgi:hypothetical protein
LRLLSLCYIHSDEKMDPSFTIAAGPRQRSYSQVQVPRVSWPHSALRLDSPPIWRTKSSYLYLPGTGWPGYTLRHWVPFSSSATTRRYSAGSPHGSILTWLPSLSCLWLLGTDRVENPFSKSISSITRRFVAVGTYLQGRCLETGLVYLLISRSSNSNCSSTRYIMNNAQIFAEFQL